MTSHWSPRQLEVWHQQQHQQRGQQVPQLPQTPPCRMPPSAPSSLLPQQHQQPQPQSQVPDQRAAHNPLKELEAKMVAALENLHNQTSTRLERMEIAIGSLAKFTSEALQADKTTRKEAKDGFDRLQTIVLQSSRCYLAKAEKVEKLLGDPDATDPDNTTQTATVFGRVQSLERSILELSEGINDPDAALSTVVKHDMETMTSPVLGTDVAIDAVDLALPPPTSDMAVQVDVDVPVMVDAGVDPPSDVPIMVDVSVEARSESPRGFSTGSQTIYAPSPERVQARFSSCTFQPQPLAPAQWTPRVDTGEIPVPSEKKKDAGPLIAQGSSSQDDSRSPSTTTTPSPFAPAITLFKDVSPPIENTAPRKPSSIETSSVVDEQEIVNSLERTSSPMPPNLNPTKTTTRHRHPTLPPAHAPSLSPPLTTRPTVAPLNKSFSEPSVIHRLLSPDLGQAVTPGSSSLSSLSTDGPISPFSATEDSANANAMSLPALTRSISLSSLSSLSSLASSHPPPVSQRQKINDRAVKVKTERTETASFARPAKRRKTAGANTEFEYEPTSASVRGSGSAARVRKMTRDRGGGGSKAGKRKSAQLVITPIWDTPHSTSSKNVNAAKAGGTGNQNQGSYEVPRIGTDCPWPAKISGNDLREFVQCDHCEGWYHFGCVGLTEGDPRLEQDAEFMCPPCEGSEDIREQRRTVRYRAAVCLRPDCDHPGETNEFFVERIIGRRPFKREIDIDVKEPTTFMWLVKWDGYPAIQATWAADEHLGECNRIIEEFEQAAEIEGRNLGLRDHTILLNEARAAGWI